MVGVDLQIVSSDLLCYVIFSNFNLLAASGISDVLRMVEDLPVITNAECNAVYGIVGDGVVCIDTAGGKGTCSGDSGGPLG